MNGAERQHRGAEAKGPNKGLIVYNRVASLRHARGVGPRELARALGVSEGYLLGVEIHSSSADPPIGLCYRIARFFELPVEQVFSLEPIPDRPESRDRAAELVLTVLTPYEVLPLGFLERVTGLSAGEVREAVGRLEKGGLVEPLERGTTETSGLLRKKTRHIIFLARLTDAGRQTRLAGAAREPDGTGADRSEQDSELEEGGS